MSTPSTQNCLNCGAVLTPGARFCEHCGQPVPAQAAPPPQASPYSPSAMATPLPPPEQPPVVVVPPTPVYTSATSPVSQQDEPKKGMSCWMIGAIVGCLGILCLGAAAAAGYYWFQSSGVVDDIISQITDIPELISTLPIPEATDFEFAFPTDTPEPEEPTPAEPTATQGLFAIRTPTSDANQPLPGGQILTDSQVFDDFSTSDLGWSEFDDSDGTAGYADGAFFIRVKEPEWLIWVYTPGDFIPTSGEFDFWMPEGVEDGTVGLVCHYVDNQNFFYVEVDLNQGAYGLRSFINDEYAFYGTDEWLTAPAMDPTAVHHLRATCNLDQISLELDGAFVDQWTIDPPAVEGNMALVASSWDTVSPEGFIVYFDNFSGSR